MNKRNILRFTLLAWALTWATVAIFRLCGGKYNSIAGTLMASACMLIPIISVIIMQAVGGEPILKGIGMDWKINRWWFIGWLLMPVMALMTLGLASVMPGMHFSTDTEILKTAMEQMSAGGPAIEPMGFLVVELLSGLMAGCTINALFALGEEIGWRGWLLRQFNSTGFLKSCMIIGAIWGLWHAPIILMGHNYPDHPIAGVFMMVLLCVIMTPMITYIRVKSKSVIAAAIVHGTFNATAGLTGLYIEGYNDLLGAAGLPCILTFAVMDILLYIYDRYISKERIFSRPLSV